LWDFVCIIGGILVLGFLSGLWDQNNCLGFEGLSLGTRDKCGQSQGIQFFGNPTKTFKSLWDLWDLWDFSKIPRDHPRGIIIGFLQ
jgi:hypothetical protein